MPGLSSPLPPSWGVSPEVLPALKILLMTLDVEGQLPPEWARGFKQLEQVGTVLPSGTSLLHISLRAPQYGCCVLQHLLQLVLGSRCLPEEDDKRPTCPRAGKSSLESAAGRLIASGNLVSGSKLPEPRKGPPGQVAAALSAPRRRLPPEWAAGFPRLRRLSLLNVGLTGTIPASWQNSSAFPELDLL